MKVEWVSLRVRLFREISMQSGHIRTSACVANSSRNPAVLHHTGSRQIIRTIDAISSNKYTFTFFLLHVRQPPLDFVCGFLLTKPVLRRTMSIYVMFHRYTAITFS